MNNKQIITFFLFLFIVESRSTYSQISFNNYQTIESKGDIPPDFTIPTYKKIGFSAQSNEAQIALTNEQKIQYSIDEVLHSGMVTFGDEVSVFVNEIANNLLEKEPDLRSKLRFYTLKSNQCNAFTTKEGMVFVTTGLIAQLANEAQLAFILAHEIAHYKEKDNVTVSNFSPKNKKYTVNSLSIYSEEDEINADKIAMEWYFNVGYGKTDLISAFDVISYSYLPFDEVEVPDNYFRPDNFYIPASLFPTKKYEISDIDDSSDNNGPYPTILKRKEAAKLEIYDASEQANKSFLLEISTFENIRTICRFESVRTDMLEANYGKALYSIFLLEQKYPGSIFLKRMKAQAWFGLVQYKQNGIINETINDTHNQLEGESAYIHFFIRQLNNDGLQTFALRQIYDLKKSNPTDQQINAIYDRFLGQLSQTKSFTLENYSKSNFETASRQFLDKKNNISSVTDTVAVVKNNKYDRIKQKRNIENVDNFDSTKFYFYGISDIIVDPLFTELFNEKKNKYNEQERLKANYERLSNAEQLVIHEKEQNEELYINAKGFIIVDPSVTSTIHGKVNLVLSEKLKKEFSTGIETAAKELDMKATILDRNKLNKSSAESFNDQAILLNFMSQASKKDFDIFPVDYDNLEAIKNNYGTSKVLFSWVEHIYDVKPSAGEVLLMIIAYPMIPVYLSIKLFTGNHTKMNVVVLDLDKGQVDVSTSYSFTDKPKKYQLTAHMYNILKKMSKSKTQSN